MKVLDLSIGFSGRYGTRLLADFGETVLEVRLPVDPANPGQLNLESGAVEGGQLVESHLNRNKTSTVLDYTEQQHLATLHQLVDSSDFVVHTFGPATAEALGLDRQSLEGRRSCATVVSVTGYGHSGPDIELASTEKTLFAHGGGTLISGRAGREPLALNLPIPSVMGGIYVAICALAVDFGASRACVPPRHLDIALRDLLPENLEKILPFYSYLSAVPYRQAGHGGLSSGVGTGTFAARDGLFHCFAGTRPMSAIAELIGRPDLVEDAKWTDPSLRESAADEINEAVREGIAKASIAELTERAAEQRLPSGQVLDVSQLHDEPNLKERGSFNVNSSGEMEIEEPFVFLHTRRKSMPVHPVSVSEAVGDATREVPPARTVGGANERLPLSGIRVLDLTHAYAGPTSTRILAELGAEVIKVESITHMDVIPRGLLPCDNDTSGSWWEKSGYFAERNANKKGLTLDLTTERGRDVFVGLLDKVDVVVSNFTPRVMRQWGLEPQNLLDRKPELVVLSISGFGANGPDAERPVLAGLMEAISGVTSMTRYTETDIPEGVGFAFGDDAAGLFAALAVLISITRRAGSGVGDAIDLAAIASPLPFLAFQLLEHARTGEVPLATWDPFTKGRHVLIRTDAGEDIQQRWVLAEAPGEAEEGLLDQVVAPGASTSDGRVRTSDKSREEVLRGLGEVGLIAAPLADAEEVFLDAGLWHRQVFDWYDRADVGPRPYGRLIPVLADGEPFGANLAPPPRLGQDNARILQGLLEMSDHDIVELQELGVIGSTPVTRLPRMWTIPLKLDELEALGRCRVVPDASTKLEAFRPDSSGGVDRGSHQHGHTYIKSIAEKDNIND